MKLLVKKCGLHAKQILKNLSVFFVKTTTFDCQEKISIPFLGLVFWRRQTSVKHPVSEVYLADKIVCLVKKYLYHVYIYIFAIHV